MRALILALALILPETLLAQAPMTTLADGGDGTIFFTSSTPTGPDQYLGEPQEAPAAVVQRCSSPS